MPVPIYRYNVLSHIMRLSVMQHLLILPHPILDGSHGDPGASLRRDPCIHRSRFSMAAC